MIIAKSFSRIHRQNLINYGILPLLFVNKDDYETILLKDKLEILNIRKELESGSNKLKLFNKTRDKEISLQHDLNERDVASIVLGSEINKSNKEEEQAA